MCEHSKLFQKSTYLDIPFTHVSFPLETFLIWFNCFFSWPHKFFFFFFLSKHLFYFPWYWMPQAQHPEILANQMHERRMISQTGRGIFHNGSYLWRLTGYSTIRWTLGLEIYFLLLLSMFEYSLVPPWDKKWLTLRILEWLPERNWLWELSFSRFP